MTRFNTNPEISPRLANFDNLFSGISAAFNTPSLSSPAALVSTTANDRSDPPSSTGCQPQARPRSATSPSKVLHNPPTLKESALKHKGTADVRPVIDISPQPPPTMTLHREEHSQTNTSTPYIDPKTFEILFIYDDSTNPTALSCGPSFAIGQQFILSANDIFISNVEWHVRYESRQHFLTLSCASSGLRTCRVFLLAEGATADREKESVALLSEYGRPLRRLGWQGENSNQGKTDEVEMKNISFRRKSTATTNEMLSERHRFIRKISLTSQSFNLIQLAILADVVAKYCPYYQDLPSLSLWLTTITYCIIKRKTPLESMLETLTDGYGRVFRDLKCSGYESSLLKPHSKKQLPYYLRKFDKAMSKFVEENERKENGISLANSNSGQEFGSFKSPVLVISAVVEQVKLRPTNLANKPMLEH